MDPQMPPQDNQPQSTAFPASPAGDPFAPQENFNPVPYVPLAPMPGPGAVQAAPQPQPAQPFGPSPAPQPFGQQGSSMDPAAYGQPYQQPPQQNFAQPQPQPAMAPSDQFGGPMPGSPINGDMTATSYAPSVLAPSDPKMQIVERLKGSVNVLVTVSNNPTVDQLAAAIGLTLVLNKLKKHATAVFSGQVPSVMEFLEPEKTLEKNTDSLQDFIIALDKSKADKLRYKIEDKYVKIFITPYHTSLSEKDLEFGQGDLNVDVIIALGVDHREELDQAVMAHGRILHDATVISITKDAADDIGTINWHAPEASSFSEIIVGLSEVLKSPQTELFDSQIATAFLTGIVAETARFSNEKTTPQTMTMSAILMRAGANQQLIANKLEEHAPVPESTMPLQVPAESSLFDIPKTDSSAPASDAAMPEPVAEEPVPMPADAPKVNADGSLDIPHAPEEVKAEDIHIDDEGQLHLTDPTPIEEEPLPASVTQAEPGAMSLPPIGGVDPAGKTLEQLEKAVNHDDQTLEEIEAAVDSIHLHQQPTGVMNDVPEHVSTDEAEKHIAEALAQSDPAAQEAPKPFASLNSVPVDLDMGHSDVTLPDPMQPVVISPTVNVGMGGTTPSESPSPAADGAAPPATPPPFTPPEDVGL